jgi:hypothetical protein
MLTKKRSPRRIEAAIRKKGARIRRRSARARRSDSSHIELHMQFARRVKTSVYSKLWYIYFIRSVYDYTSDHRTTSTIQLSKMEIKNAQDQTKC